MHTWLNKITQITPFATFGAKHTLSEVRMRTNWGVINDLILGGNRWVDCECKMSDGPMKDP